MIRFRTVDPSQAEKPASQPAPPARPPMQPAEPEAEGNDAAEGQPKGLTRKTPLRAKKAEAAPLFDK